MFHVTQTKKQERENISLTQSQEQHLLEMFHNIRTIKCIQYNSTQNSFYQEEKKVIEFSSKARLDYWSINFYEDQDIMYTSYKNSHPVFLFQKDESYSLYQIEKEDVDTMFNYVRTVAK